MAEEIQHPNPTRHFHLRLDLQARSDPVPITGRPNTGESTTEIRFHQGTRFRRRRGIREREGLNGESGGHVLRLTRFDLAGGYEHKPDLRTRVNQLNRAVVVGESGLVGVLDGDVLREGEVDGVVRDGE